MTSEETRSDWEARVRALNAPRREPLSIRRIVAASLALVSGEGFEQLTMRKVAAALGVSPGALYVHVADKAQLGDLMLAELCSRVVVPDPDPSVWQEQVVDVCEQLLTQYVSCPGIGYAVFASAPVNLEAMRLTEGMLQILVSAGGEVRAASWAVDAALIFVAAFSVVSLRRIVEPGGIDRDELASRYRMLPADRFPVTTAHADQILDGTLDERFATTINRIFHGVIDDHHAEGNKP